MYAVVFKSVPAAKVQLATHDDVDAAIDAAVAATPAMAALAAYERKAILEKVTENRNDL